MKSAIYHLSIEHHRLSPKRHSFKNGHYMLFLDLSMLGELSESLRMFSLNGFGLFDFRDADYLHAGNESIYNKLTRFLAQEKCEAQIEKIFLLASPRHLGYVFNPLSVYYCFDKDMQLKAVVSEVCNTFHERKAFLLNQSHYQSEIFKAEFDKQFYISPFTRLDDKIKFEIDTPAEELNIQVTTSRNDQTVLIASMHGKRRELSDGELLKCMFKYPFSNFLVTAGIHLHAFRLWLKGVPHIRKESDPQLQTKILRSMK